MKDRFPRLGWAKFMAPSSLEEEAEAFGRKIYAALGPRWSDIIVLAARAAMNAEREGKE